MSEKNRKVITFLRKNAYYFVFLICLAVLVTITVALVIAGNSGGGLTDLPTVENPSDGNVSNPNDGGNSQPSTPEQPSIPDGDSEPDKPTSTVIVFDAPVRGTIIKDYVAAGVVYNQTLNLYSGHKAIDFAADEGSEVYACYGGTIDSITESKLEGVTVTIDHGNGLKSYYNSMEATDDLSVGQTVNKGDVIGYVALNNRTEYLDGAHLHFSVTENGQKINPEKYLLVEEK